MRIYTLDTEWPGIEQLDFDRPDSTAHLDTAGILIWRPASTLARHAMHTERIDDHGRPVLTPAASQQLLASSRRWRDAFELLTARDGLLVVLLDNIAPLGVHTLQEVVSFDVQEILPGDPVVLTSITHVGAPDWRCGAPFRQSLERLGRASQANTGIDCAQGTVLATGPDRHEAVALYRYQRPGHLLMMPTPTVNAGTRSLMIALAAALTGRPEIAVTPADPAVLYHAERQALQTIAANRAQQRQLEHDVLAQQRRLHRLALARTVAAGLPADAARAWELLLPGLGARADGEETAPAMSVGFIVGERRALVQFADMPGTDAPGQDPIASLRALAASRYGAPAAATAWIRQAVQGKPGAPDRQVSRACLAGLVFDDNPQAALVALLDPVNGALQADRLAAQLASQQAAPSDGHT